MIFIVNKKMKKLYAVLTQGINTSSETNCQPFMCSENYLLSGHQSIQLFTMWTQKYDEFKGEI